MEHKGKHICKILRDVRKQIADANGIDYTPGECHHEGFCKGTCPMCEKEKSFLEQQISLRQKAGKAIKIVGIASGLVALAAQPMSAQPPEALQEDTVLNWDLHFFDFCGGPIPAYQEIFDEVAEFTCEYPEDIYVVIGKTDSRGSEKYNLKISEKRAFYIWQMLKHRNEDKPLRIVHVGAAYYEPSIENAQDEVEHEQNRKVTIETYSPKRHSGKVSALIEYAICKEFKISIPQKIETKYNTLNQQPYDKSTMKGKYDTLAEELRKLRN